MVIKKCKMDISKAKDLDFTEGFGEIEITDDAQGRVYFQLNDGCCLAVNLPDLLSAIQKAIMSERGGA